MNEKYDVICVFNPATGEERIDAVIARIEKKLKVLGGTIDKVSKMGLRRVQTRMRSFKNIKDGYFVELNINSPKNGPAEVEDVLKVTEEIMRHIITKAIVRPVFKDEKKAAEEAVEINPEMIIGKPQ
jgi:small subunit ribosomal protein S6